MLDIFQKVIQEVSEKPVHAKYEMGKGIVLLNPEMNSTLRKPLFFHPKPVSGKQTLTLAPILIHYNILIY